MILTIEKSGSYLRHVKSNDWQSSFRADTITGRHKAVKPPLWATEGGAEAVVDTKRFSDLKSVDLTSLSKGETVEIGTLKDGKAMKRRELVRWLLESEVLRTYAHVEATVRLLQDAESDGSYAADFEGTHVYFTNEKHESSYAFRIRLDVKTGLMTVEGR